MDGKGVKKLTNGVEKFGALDHFSAGLDGICRGITNVNDAFRLLGDAHQLSKPAILYFPIHTTFLCFAAGKNFDLSICLDRTQRCPVLLIKRICETKLVNMHGSSFS